MNVVSPAWFYNLQHLREHCQPIMWRGRLAMFTPSIFRIVRFVEQLEMDIMPPSKKQGRKATNFPEIEFVTVRLDKEQAGAFADWVHQDDESRSLDLAEFISAGHKTSITWDDYNSCFIVSSTCKDEGSDNFNKCLSSRSNDWYEAMMMNVYKANVLLAKGPWESDASTNSWG